MDDRRSRKTATTKALRGAAIQSVFLMRGVRIDRLSLDTRGLIFSLVKTGNTASERTDTVTKFTYRHPTSAQLYALELSARRARSQAQARLLRAGVSAVKSLFARAFSSAASLFARESSRASNIQREVAPHA
jgi:hypothetical protein